jgi:hypothetical protein
MFELAAGNDDIGAGVCQTQSLRMTDATAAADNDSSLTS